MTFHEWWTMEMDCEWESENSVLSARLDDCKYGMYDDSFVCLFCIVINFDLPQIILFNGIENVSKMNFSCFK